MLLFIPKSGAELRVVRDADEGLAWMKRTGYSGRVVEISEGRTLDITKPPPASVHGQGPAPAPVISQADFKALLASNAELAAELRAIRGAKAPKAETK